MPSINPYLTFAGNCEEAFNYYKSVFGGEFLSFSRFGDMPPQEGVTVNEADKDLVMHVTLPLSQGNVIMGSDTEGECAPNRVSGNNVSLSVNASTREEADSLFASLSAGGQVTMPLENAFWGSYFGMCTDKFGINWMVSFGQEAQS
jgi:PhnB protein